MLLRKERKKKEEGVWLSTFIYHFIKKFVFTIHTIHTIHDTNYKKFVFTIHIIHSILFIYLCEEEEKFLQQFFIVSRLFILNIL